MSAEFPMWARTTFDEPEDEGDLWDDDLFWSDYDEWLEQEEADQYQDAYDQYEYILDHADDV